MDNFTLKGAIGIDKTMPIVDAHHHFWNPTINYHPWLNDEPVIPFRYGDYSAIRKPYLPLDYFNDAKNWNIVKTVYVETEWNPLDSLGETKYIHAIAQEYGFPNAVVAHARLDSPEASELIAAHATYPLVRSIRHKPNSALQPNLAKRNEPGSMDDPRWREGFACLEQQGLHFDLQTPWWHMDAAFDLAKDFPSTQIIINHAGLPADRSKEGLHAWKIAMEKVAQADNVSVKISGIGRGNHIPWTIEDNQFIIHTLIDIFGVDRCMFASNFPVDSVCATFDTIYSGFFECVTNMTEVQKNKLFYANAMRFYRPA